MPCGPGHKTWLNDLQKSLGPDVSALLLAYDLAPEHTYPTQLKQAIELLPTPHRDRRTQPLGSYPGRRLCRRQSDLGVLVTPHAPPSRDPTPRPTFQDPRRSAHFAVGIVDTDEYACICCQCRA